MSGPGDPAGSEPAPGPADLLIIDGRVFQAYGPRELAPYGSDIGPRPVAAPNAVAIRDGKIAWVGRMDEGRRDWEGPRTRVIEARGGLITAGFDDAHIHVLSGAEEAGRVDLFQLPTVDAIQDAIAAHAAANPGDPWVQGRGWMYVPFPGGLPTRELLDAVVPHRPAFMRSYDGHTDWVNSAALRAAGIDRETPDPWDGEIVRDRATGQATGILKEGAQALMERVLPRPTTDALLAAARRSIAALHRSGITAIQELDVPTEDVALWRALRDDGSLRLRTRLALPLPSGTPPDDWTRVLDGYDGLVGDLRGGEWLDAGMLKFYADGVIEARTAAMLAPYLGDDSAGRPEWSSDHLDGVVEAAHRRGWQVGIHAVGDGGVRMALDAFERLGHDAARHRRHRVEHIETVDRADIRRFAELGVVASMQPYHADPSPNQIDRWAGNIGPDRASRAWAWQSIRREGGVIALGSDWPIVPFDPFRALNSACNRQTMEGQPPGGWLPSEKLSLPDALAAYGFGSAYAAHAEGRRGTIKAGMDADLIVLDRDILAGGPASIMGTTVALTVVGGEIVHASEDVA